MPHPLSSQISSLSNIEKYTGNPRKLALGLFVGKGLFQNIKFTTFVRPWSYLWGHGPTSGEALPLYYTVEILILEKITQLSF